MTTDPQSVPISASELDLMAELAELAGMRLRLVQRGSGASPGCYRVGLPDTSSRRSHMASGHSRPRSWEVTEGPERAPARAMLRAVGFSEEDFGKPQVAVASSWNEVTPCDHHDKRVLSHKVRGLRRASSRRPR